MPARTWRRRFAPLIAEVLAATAGLPDREVNRALRQLWDGLGLGVRGCWPYTVFRSEVRRQGGPSRAGVRGVGNDQHQARGSREAEPVLPGLEDDPSQNAR